MSISAFQGSWSPIDRIFGGNPAGTSRHQQSGRRKPGSRNSAPYKATRSQLSGGLLAAVLPLLGIRSRYRQVDYRGFRELLGEAFGGRVLSWGRDTYLYDSANRLIAIKRAARFHASGRCQPPRYFVRCVA